MSPTRHREVVAAVNPGDAYYEAVLCKAQELAQGASFTVLSIFPRPLQLVSDPLEGLDAKTAADRGALALAIEQDAKRLGLGPLNVLVPLAHRADVGVDIVERADDLGTTVLVLGTHGRTGLESWIVGSVAQYVVRRAHCDVYIVRSRPSGTLGASSS